MATQSGARKRAAEQSLRGMQSLSKMSQKLRTMKQLTGKNPAKVEELISALDEVATGLQEEEDAARALAMQRTNDMKVSSKELESSISTCTHVKTSRNESLQVATSAKEEMETRLAALKDQLTESYNQIDTLEASLKASRQEQAFLMEQTANTTFLIQAAIDRATRESKKHRMGLPNNLRGEVSYLQKLGERLPSFVQTSSTRQKATPRDILVLTADKQQIQELRTNQSRDFEQQGQDNLELIKEEKGKIEVAEKEMDELQTALINQMKNIGEIQLQLSGATRCIERDEAMLVQIRETHQATSSASAKLDSIRHRVIMDIRSAKPLITHMNVEVLLSKDMQGFQKSPPTFLQMHSNAMDSSFSSDDTSTLLDDEGKDTLLLQRQEMLAAMARASGAASGSEAASASSHSSTKLQSASSAQSFSGNPFDEVTQMIDTLITNLREQMNEDMTQDQFCRDQIAANMKERKQTRDEMADFETKKQLAEDALGELDAQLMFVNEEVDRLTEAVSQCDKDKAAEEKRIDAQVEGHDSASSVLSNSIVILQQLCNLPGFLQIGMTDKHEHKEESPASKEEVDNCAEAAEILGDSVTGVGELKTASTEYKTTYSTLMDKQKSAAEAALAAKEGEKTASTTQRATRHGELVAAKEALKTGKEQLTTIEKAGSTLESDCSHVESHEEKQARRQEEIDALKEALRVLEGEAVPAYSL